MKVKSNPPRLGVYKTPTGKVYSKSEEIKAMLLWLLEEDKTFCKDCGAETKPDSGSARCPSCWDDKCGHNTDE